MGNFPGSFARERIYVSTTDTFDAEADLDFIAIEAVINGDPVRLTTAEKIFAARFLDGRGMTPSAIAYLIRSTAHTVRGWKDNGWKRRDSATPPPVKEREEPVCGERRMYRRHLAAGESCDVCRAANTAADRRYRLTGSTEEAA
ncbi:hypothetical protein Saso_26970 [Streptomyces asoensis]|uniref:Helix-turn-helix domain-containing protein n=2 Tax=Streptomyces asoensis TaxID=249586 RepID=A0ABQ3RYU4_9ACTN|nr:hypothetical protein GCM10010496_08550 [Streptomyces asoensis]GHI61047.1 hypothetical protein Saso_26970 [Streptomyces asoensis]